MKSFVFALFLSVALCGATLACPNSGPCTCPSPCDAPDIAVVAEQAVDAAKALCAESGMAVGRLGPQAERACFGIQNTVTLLSSNGVSKDDLASLTIISEKLRAALKAARPSFIQGMVTAQYADMLRQTANGDPVTLLQSATSFCQAAECFSAAEAALESTEALVKEAESIAVKLLESLEVPVESV